jgi:hypothetical protein
MGANGEDSDWCGFEAGPWVGKYLDNILVQRGEALRSELVVVDPAHTQFGSLCVERRCVCYTHILDSAIERRSMYEACARRFRVSVHGGVRSPS